MIVEFAIITMLSQTDLCSDAVSEILGYLGETGVLKLSDYNQLIRILSESTDEIEKISADRILRFVRRGRIKIEDDSYN